MEDGETEGPGADPRAEVKNVLDDAAHPTGACREEEDPGLGLGPEMYERQYSGLPPDLLELHQHHIVPYTFCKIQIYIDEKFSSVLMSCHI